MTKKRANAATPTPGLVAGMVENINSWPANVRLLIAQCIISGDVLDASTHKGQVNRHSKYAPLAKPQQTTMLERSIWLPGDGNPGVALNKAVSL